MDVIFDIEPLQNPEYKDRGIGRYTRSLLNAYAKLGHRLFLTFNAALPPPELGDLQFNAEVFQATRKNFRAHASDWLVTTSPFERSLGRTAELFHDANPQGRTATIWYDAIPLVFEEDFLSDPLTRLRYNINLQSSVKSDAVLAISDHSAADFKKYVNDRTPVFTIGTGVDEPFFQSDSPYDADMEWKGFLARVPSLRGRKFLLTISGGHRSKNLRGLLSEYAKLPILFRVAHPLVIGGGISATAQEHFLSEWTKISGSPSDQSEIIFLPKISDAQLRQLYRRASLFVCYSSYEGFGLPLAEAITSSCLSLSLRNSSLVEIVQDSPYGWSRMSSKTFAETVIDLVTDTTASESFDRWASARREGFRWSNVARSLEAALRSFETRTPTTTSTRSNTAIVGSLPPARSGISTYNKEIVRCLESRTDITWIASDGHAPLGGNKIVKYLPVYENTWQAYDRRLSVVGNSFHHIQALRMLAKFGGGAWLHDVRLSGLAWNYANEIEPNTPWKQIDNLLSQYPGHVSHNYDLGALAENVYSFARPLLKNARYFIVHSHHAKSLLRQDLGGCEDPRPIHVVPLAITAQRRSVYTSDGKRRRSGDNIVIGLLGFMAPIRAPEAVIKAASMLVARGTSCSIRVIGLCSEAYASVLTTQCAALDVPISFSGFVTEADFLDEVAATDIVVQFRKTSNGESSATVAAAISMAVPVLSNIPSVREFWGDATIHINDIWDTQIVANAIERTRNEDHRAKLIENYDQNVHPYSFEEVSSQILRIVEDDG